LPSNFINHKLTFPDFLTAYLGIPIFFGLYGFWKIFKRTKWVRPEDADIYTGKAALDAEDGQWPDLTPRNMFERIWFWIA
jgi:amino acid transporter